MAAFNWLLPNVCYLMLNKSFMFVKYFSPHNGCIYIYKVSSQCEFFDVFQECFCEKALSQRLHSKGFSPMWIRWCISRVSFLEKALSHCLFIWFLPRVSSLIYFKSVFEKKCYHNGCIQKVYHQCEFVDVLQELLFLRKPCNIGYIYDFSPGRVF